VHPHHGRAAGLRIEEVPAEVAIGEQHELRGGERADGEDDQSGHDEVQPDEQRHLAERHPGAAHGEDGGDDVDGRADAAEAGDEQRQRPEVRAVPGREGLRGQRA